MRKVSLKENRGKKELKILEKRRELFFINTILKQAMMRTIVGNFIRS